MVFRRSEANLAIAVMAVIFKMTQKAYGREDLRVACKNLKRSLSFQLINAQKLC